jgi:hypothetical protein
MMHLLVVLVLLFTAAAAGTAAGLVAAALLLRRYLRRKLTNALPWRDLQRRARIAYLERWHRQWEQAHR